MEDKKNNTITGTNHSHLQQIIPNISRNSHLVGRGVSNPKNPDRPVSKPAKRVPVKTRLSLASLHQWVLQGLSDAEIAEKTNYSKGYIKNCRHAYGIFRKLIDQSCSGDKNTRFSKEQVDWGRVPGATARKCLAGGRYEDNPAATKPEGLWRYSPPETLVLSASSADWAVRSTPDHQMAEHWQEPENTSRLFKRKNQAC